jgi:hypothetical protein
MPGGPAKRSLDALPYRCRSGLLAASLARSRSASRDGYAPLRLRQRLWACARHAGAPSATGVPPPPHVHCRDRLGQLRDLMSFSTALPQIALDHRHLPAETCLALPLNERRLGLEADLVAERKISMCSEGSRATLSMRDEVDRLQDLQLFLRLDDQGRRGKVGAWTRCCPVRQSTSAGPAEAASRRRSTASAGSAAAPRSRASCWLVKGLQVRGLSGMACRGSNRAPSSALRPGRRCGACRRSGETADDVRDCAHSVQGIRSRFTRRLVLLQKDSYLPLRVDRLLRVRDGRRRSA